MKLFVLIAARACNDNVALYRSTATGDRHDMVHRELPALEPPATIMTGPPIKLGEPPLCFSERLGARAFTPDIGILCVRGV